MGVILTSLIFHQNKKLSNLAAIIIIFATISNISKGKKQSSDNDFFMVTSEKSSHKHKIASKLVSVIVTVFIKAVISIVLMII